MSLFDVIEDKVFDVHWYFTTERPIRKSMKRFGDTMDQAIAILNEAAAKEPGLDNGNSPDGDSDREMGMETQAMSVDNGIHQLGMQEKTAILAVLVKLMAAKRPADKQREYFQVLKNHFGVRELPTVVPYLPRCSEAMQECLFQIITEFLCVAEEKDDDVVIRFMFHDDNPDAASESVFRKLRRKAGIHYGKAGEKILSGEDVLCALQIDLEAKKAMAFKTLELYHSLGAEGIKGQYPPVAGTSDQEKEMQGQLPVCSFEQWEKIQYELLAQDLLDSIYEDDYAAEMEYKAALEALWEKLQKGFEDGQYTEADVAGRLAENGIYIDLMKKEHDARQEIAALTNSDPGWQDSLKKEGSALCMETEELQRILDEGDERRYRAWIDCISKEQLTEDELWEKAVQIGLIPDAEKVLRLREELRCGDAEPDRQKSV